MRFEKRPLDFDGEVADAQVKQLLVDKFGVSEEEISPSATFSDLDLDSLDLVEFAERRTAAGVALARSGYIVSDGKQGKTFADFDRGNISTAA